MAVRIATRTGVQLPSPPGFTRDEVASEACRGVARASDEVASEACRGVARAKPDLFDLRHHCRELRLGKPVRVHGFYLHLHLAK